MTGSKSQTQQGRDARRRGGAVFGDDADAVGAYARQCETPADLYVLL
ncbi:hypothetical protein NKH36_18525 [Mesorhizobium sp. M1312]